MVVPGTESVAFEDRMGDIASCELETENGFPELPRPAGGTVTEDRVDLWMGRFPDQRAEAIGATQVVRRFGTIVGLTIEGDLR